MDFDESVRYMSGLIRFGWKLDLERITELCARLGNPQERYGIVHVAGTKGKGSTTVLSAGILQAAGFRVGAYFSPYVYDVRERIQINGQPIPRDDFARIVTQIRPLIETLAGTEFGQTTEFELKTLVGFVWFAEQNVDWACIEVGIGGRLDATNVVKPDVTVITNIGLDHTQILGDTRAQIAVEKAGIFKCGVPSFTATEAEDALEVIQRIAHEREVPLTRIRRVPGGATIPDAIAGTQETEGTVWWQVPTDAEHTGPVTIQTPMRRYAGLPMRMAGVYQRGNAACAVAAVENALRRCGVELSESAVREGLANAALPGRFTVLRLNNGPLVVLDGAHNALAAESLAGPVQALESQEKTNRLLLVVGMVGGHEPDGVLAPFASRAAHIYACQPDWKRALPAEAIGEAARRYNPAVTVMPSVPEAVRAALTDANANDLVLITGSFYTVGEAPPEMIASLWAKRKVLNA